MCSCVPACASSFILPNGLADAFEQLAAELLRSQPFEVVRAVGDLLTGVRSELAMFSSMRTRALNELRARGATYSQIGAVAGLSKSRVAQLASERRPYEGEKCARHVRPAIASNVVEPKV
jgi:hypothetical protein